MNRPSVLFIDVAGLEQMQRLLPQLQVHSERVDGLEMIHFGSQCSFEITHQVFLPLPVQSFTRHLLRLAVADSVNQPLLLEAGFLSLGSWILTERNPANAHLPSLTCLRRRALPGLRWSWWPWASLRHPWRHIPGSGRSRLRTRLIQGSAHVLTSFNNPNWYHWLTLPGLGSLNPSSEVGELILSDRSLPLNGRATPKLLERVAFLARTLTATGQVRLERGPIKVQQLEACFIENHTNLVCDSKALARLHLATLSMAPSTGLAFSAVGIYLRRGPEARRPLFQENCLERALLQRGFVVIDLEAISLPECISTFAKARWVVAPHGAALTNLVFSKPGTRVLELLPGPLEKFGHYSLMAAALGLSHSHMIGEHLAGGGFLVDQQRLLNWLDQALIDTAP